MNGFENEADFESALFSKNFWSHPPGSNRRPADYESAALPTELGWLFPILPDFILTTSLLNRYPIFTQNSRRLRPIEPLPRWYPRPLHLQ
jgi:hypothetical protein